MVMFLLCWELKLGCWLQSIIATLWKTLLENDGVYFDKSDFILFWCSCKYGLHAHINHPLWVLDTL